MKGRKTGCEMDTDIKEIEARIAELKARWPAHTVPATMERELEELEEKLEAARQARGESDVG